MSSQPWASFFGLTTLLPQQDYISCSYFPVLYILNIKFIGAIYLTLSISQVEITKGGNRSFRLTRLVSILTSPPTTAKILPFRKEGRVAHFKISRARDVAKEKHPPATHVFCCSHSIPFQQVLIHLANITVSHWYLSLQAALTRLFDSRLATLLMPRHIEPPTFGHYLIHPI